MHPASLDSAQMHGKLLLTAGIVATAYAVAALLWTLWHMSPPRVDGPKKKNPGRGA
jgi:hypothetical protein